MSEQSEILKEGEKAPSFSLPNSHGEETSLESLLDDKLLLYFYPKDSTPGCTKQACGYRDAYDDLDITIVGVSGDSVESHERFKTNQSLPFMLLSDEHKTTIREYGVIGETQHFGKPTLTIKRTAFLIDKDGTIEKVWKDVDPEQHASQVKQYLEK